MAVAAPESTEIESKTVKTRKVVPFTPYLYNNLTEVPYPPPDMRVAIVCTKEQVEEIKYSLQLRQQKIEYARAKNAENSARNKAKRKDIQVA